MTHVTSTHVSLAKGESNHPARVQDGEEEWFYHVLGVGELNIYE